MKEHSRTVKVLLSLVVSMTAGALVLMVMDKQSISAGPFSLSSYIKLNSIDQVTSSYSSLSARQWNCIEVWVSRQPAEKLLAQSDLNFHFTILDGNCDQEGLIKSTQKWDRQLPCLPDNNWYGSDQTIRICVTTVPGSTGPTDCQVQRTNALVEKLSRQFHVPGESIIYPVNWQL